MTSITHDGANTTDVKTARLNSRAFRNQPNSYTYRNG